jgi:TRAP-type C4-dicarboxylate transport system permease small subunit
VATKETLRSRYVGVPTVSSVLFVLGWVMAIFGFFVAIGMATTDELELSTGERLGIFFGILYLFWMVAFTLLAYAYMVRLLSDIERRLAGSGSSSRVGR